MAGFKDLYEETNCIYPMECIQVLLGYMGKMLPQDFKEIMEYCGEQTDYFSRDTASDINAVREAMQESKSGSQNLRSSILKHSR